jgi:hypothetical protein
VFTQKNSYYRSTGILVKETQHAEYPSKYNLKKRFKIQIQFKYLLFLAIKVSKGYHLHSCWEKKKSKKNFDPTTIALGRNSVSPSSIGIDVIAIQKYLT